MLLSHKSQWKEHFGLHVIVSFCDYYLGGQNVMIALHMLVTNKAHNLRMCCDDIRGVALVQPNNRLRTFWSGSLFGFLISIVCFV